MANRPNQAISEAYNALKSLGFVIEFKSPNALSVSDFEIQQWGLVTDSGVEIWMHIRMVLAQSAREPCLKAEGVAKTCYRICIGEDETFDATYGEAAKRVDFGGTDLVEEVRKMMVR